ncbi:MAG TPA: gliding motility-associated C-terminal domain-containing protein, partial [Mucilaginibacter sp.]|nr:gliding motility-associated C-terminal domain-containing protein [Mucilaginibacter sp.]
ASLTYFPRCIVSIYARNGSLVFQSKGYARPWDGTYHGSALPNGTYYYIIDPQEGMKQLSGSVTILR